MTGAEIDSFMNVSVLVKRFRCASTMLYFYIRIKSLSQKKEIIYVSLTIYTILRIKLEPNEEISDIDSFHSAIIYNSGSIRIFGKSPLFGPEG